MKMFLRKRWHGIPVGIVSALLALVLITGVVVAAYPFLTSTVEVDVVEAIAVGVWPDWDNLEPYGALDDVDITITEDGGNPVFTITTTGSGEYGGSGFTAGEWIVIPLNIRNGSSAPLNLSASVAALTGPSGGNLALDYIWQTNPGPYTTQESGQDMYREFKASGTWASLDSWSAAIAGNGGKSGSAVVGAKVLFVKISPPEDVVPGAYTYTVILSRG